MTRISIHAGAPLGHPSSIARVLLDRLAKAAKRRRNRRGMKELSQLPRHLLRDMGLEHCAAPDAPTISNHWR
ncbi:MAG: DUF1127 domain-containing protein [Pseudomonadota bacterium]